MFVEMLRKKRKKTNEKTRSTICKGNKRKNREQRNGVVSVINY
jgi:hypothetical protein